MQIESRERGRGSLWAGLHYRSADVEGQRLGRNVANYGAANYLQPVGN